MTKKFHALDLIATKKRFFKKQGSRFKSQEPRSKFQGTMFEAQDSRIIVRVSSRKNQVVGYYKQNKIQSKRLNLVSCTLNFFPSLPCVSKSQIINHKSQIPLHLMLLLQTLPPICFSYFYFCI